MNLSYTKDNINKDSSPIRLLKIQSRNERATEKTGLCINTQDGVEVILFSEILYCSSDSNYTSIYCRNNRKVIVSKTLKVIHNALPKTSFVRIHRSHLIAIHEVKGMSTTEVTLINGKSLPVSMSKRKDLIEILKDHFTFV
jgi:two-component system LytT family response regulator